MSKSKNDIFYLIVLILTIITLMVGITFTYFSLVAKEKDDSTKVKTGSIAINYIDGASINSNGLIPRKEPSLGENYAVYTKRFAISSSGTLDQTLDIYINVTKNDESMDLKYMQNKGFTVREIEILTGISKSQVSRELKE